MPSPKSSDSLVNQVLLGANPSATSSLTPSIRQGGVYSRGKAGIRKGQRNQVDLAVINAIASKTLDRLTSLETAINDLQTAVTAVANNTIGANLGSINVNLPTSDPSITGALWNDSGTVKVSAP